MSQSRPLCDVTSGTSMSCRCKPCFCAPHPPPQPPNICKLNSAASYGCRGVADERVRPSNPLTFCLGSRGPKQSAFSQNSGKGGENGTPLVAFLTEFCSVWFVYGEVEEAKLFMRPVHKFKTLINSSSVFVLASRQAEIHLENPTGLY